MTTTPVQVAIIGCGRVSGHHCRSVQGVKGIQLAAVCDLIEDKAQVYGKEFSVPHFTNYHEMFRRIPTINTVAIVTPSGMHFEHAMEIMRLYAKNVIVEKPTFLKPSQLRAAFGLANMLGLKIFPVFQNRHNLAVSRVLRGLKSGELGDVRTLAVRVRWCRPQRYYELAAWRGKFAMDGGALTNQGIHHVDLLRQFGGGVSRVQAVMKTLGAKIEVEDTVVAALEFKSGAVGTLEVTTAARPDDFEASISAVCEKGLAQIGGIAVNELQIYTPDPPACVKDSENFKGNVYGHGHEKLYSEISAFFHEGRPFSVSEDDSLNTLKLLDAFYRSDEKKDWAIVDSPDESARLGRADEGLAKIYRTALPVPT